MLLYSCILTILTLGLVLKLIFVKTSLREIGQELTLILSQDTNRSIGISSRDKELRKLVTTLNEQLSVLQRERHRYQDGDRELKEAVTNISHDLRTPLTSAMGYIGLIKDSDIPQEEKEREIEIIEKRLVRLEELIDSFFEFSKIISSDAPPEMSVLNLNAILEESVVHYYDDYCGQDRKIILNCDDPKIKILSNRNMLMRIFDNLIGNALKHGEGDLTISVKKSDTVILRFENKLTAPEIDTDRIFDEFYTTDISRTKGNTGLGLAIAKQFTDMMGGKISAQHKGDVFAVTIEFPL